ncbi:MAG: S24 family peptidase [Bacteroidales bacterium]|nr:S24 family peptidase [Bacteroidales bacterium]
MMNDAAKIGNNFQPTKKIEENFHHMTNILYRIEQIAKNEGLSITAFERSIGASKGVLSRAINNGTDIQSKWIQIIVENYPRYSTDWLLIGKGDMLVQPTKKIEENFSEKEENAQIARHAQTPQEGIPLIPFSAMAGALKGEQIALEFECEHYIVPAFSGADFLMPVKGNSMAPTYTSGDIVACQRVPMSGLFFQWNKPYVLDTAQGAIIKRIKPGSDKQHVLIVSDNPQYDPFELTYSEIYAVALVIGIIRLE